MSKPETPGTPGSLLPGGIVVIDEPESAGFTVFADNGTAVLTFNTRPGADIGQVIIGLTANQVMQLSEWLNAHSDVFGRAIAEGRGGARFPKGNPQHHE